MKTVVVDAQFKPPPRYVAKYAVLRDRSCREVMALARRNPDVWLFPFVTGAVEDCPNYRWLGRAARRDARYRLVVQPMYVGNLSPVEAAIEQVVANALGPDREEVRL